MQVNTAASHATRVDRMAGLQRQLDTLQGQIATGKRIAVPSDDPVASGIATRLERVEASGLAQLRALDSAASRLSASDAALGSAAMLLIRAQELGLAGANATLSPADRATLAGEAVAIGEQLLSIANRSASDGTPLFGGAAGTGPAFARNVSGTVVWTGSGAAPTVAGIAAGIDARAFTGPGEDAFKLIDDLATALVEPDPTRAASLSAVLSGLSGATARVADAQAGIGSLASRVDAESQRLRADGLRLAGDLAKVEGLDLATAIARLQRLATVLEATQASFVRLTSLSLWERL